MAILQSVYLSEEGGEGRVPEKMTLRIEAGEGSVRGEPREVCPAHRAQLVQRSWGRCVPGAFQEEQDCEAGGWWESGRR